MRKLFLDAITASSPIRRTGRIEQFYGLTVESNGPDVFLGELCEISRPNMLKPVLAEVVGYKNGKVLLMPCGSIAGLQVGSEVIATGRPATIPVGDALIGRAIDGFGNPIDMNGALGVSSYYPLHHEPTNPFERGKISKFLQTGIKIIDGLLSVGKGQRLGIFAGSGVGKSTLLGMIVRNIDVDVNVVALIGERGREVKEFIEETLGPEGRRKTVLVVAGADQSALQRTHAAYAAMSIAEYFKDKGKDVLLTMDSLTRFAMAQREIGLAVGEPPTARGYTPSTFEKIPRLVERAGNFEGAGSITALFTVLVEGDELNEPISDHSRAILDGHIVLSRKMANQNIYPAIDVLSSVSRVKRLIQSEEEAKLSDAALKNLGIYESIRDSIELGIYTKGENPGNDHVVEFEKISKAFFMQATPEPNSRMQVFEWLARNV